MKPAIEWGHAVEEAVAEDIQRDALDAAAAECDRFAAEMDRLKGPRSGYQGYAARIVAERLRRMKP